MHFPKFLKSDQSRFAFSLLILTACIYLIIFGYSLIFEQDKLAIDWYNFGQLEKTRNILDKLDKNSYKFDNISEFNKKFNQDIKSIKNCYFLSERNGYFEKNKGGGGYIFGFQLESLISKFVYFGKNYAYPKYDLPYSQVCFGGPSNSGLPVGGGCYDNNRNNFEGTITKPCKEY